MELEEFISTSLLQIMRGVAKAQSEMGAASGEGGVINPCWVGKEGGEKPASRVQEVKFDIAVTATTKTEGGGGGGIKVMAVELSGKGSRAVENSSVSHIAFSIPILPATTDITDDGGIAGRPRLSR
jgi:hypothetical protein